MQNRLFVGNLDFSTTESDLRSKFEEFGSLTSAALVTDRVTGQARGFGFVEFSDASAAARAVETLNGADLNGRTLNVSVARERTGGGGGGFGGGRSGGFGGGGGGGGGNRRGSGRGDRSDRW
jgi:RNA recognition motif-containing protein